VTSPTEPAGAASTEKAYSGGTERIVAPAETVAKARALMSALGITRVANITHLDRIGLPVVAVYRPNARSLSVAQGKGATLVEAQASGLMEALESHHAEHVTLPLRLESHRELRKDHRVIDVTGLPRLTSSTFHSDQRMLWVGGLDLVGGRPSFVPFESVHTDFRYPMPEGSGCFLMSSNGLASGNHRLEAISHAICELVERDAQTLWGLLPPASRNKSRVALDSIDDPRCREALNHFEQAQMQVGIWSTTSEFGIPSFVCTIVDRDLRQTRPMAPASGAGCHPRRRIALLRALTEAAQSRLTVIAGARDDLEAVRYSESIARASASRCLEELRVIEAGLRFNDVEEAVHDTLEGDVRWQLERLEAGGIRQVVVVDLTKAEFGVPVVRVVIPHLESLNGLRGYVPGKRAHAALKRSMS
jgi:YcaO-like protein with predicted kinase domain